MSYPPSPSEAKLTDPHYQDQAAAVLYKNSGGPELAKSAATITRALTRQAELLEQFHSTPFSKQNVATIKTTLEALERTQAALDYWHRMIYPNQRPAA